ncbi:glycosyltransferase 87 family protein [Amycolatopsis saalfeldensis]|uniref:Alpha-1,2-mannosyltransferase n=1 Tax=Amycolatopsis saalfeldensis TaxID=394193 RepID=A0A1H8U869_9PSEU|nr:glycosyltransferase 87 family protein [Amycolatopsis saalfeldensis]SEO99381.1 alpha-1,2-mannosyltransferase [Amycolatopsis saalfeldensis]
MDQGKKASIALLAVIAGLTAIAGCRWLYGLPLGVDSTVYRAGALAVLRGQPLYDPLLALDPESALELPFTYPPSAALLFLPLALFPAQLVWLLFAVGTVLALWSVLRRFSGTRPVLLLVLLAVLEPVWRSIGLGQVNALLMALVVWDVLPSRDRRYGGVLIGLAAAVKLTPLIFIPHLFLTGRRADGFRALAAFSGASAIGALVLPGDSARYWTSAVVDNRNAGSVGWVGNQSLHGMLARFGVTSMAWYAALAALCLLLGALLVREFHRRGDPRAALLVTAGCALLVSPISWTHHWIWVVALAGYLAGRRAAPAGAAAVFTGLATASVPGGGHRELSWSPIQMVLGNAYVLAALAAGAVLTVRLLIRPGGRDRTSRDRLSAKH